MKLDQNTRWSRREFVGRGALLTGSLAANRGFPAITSSQKKKPNFLFINTDQQHANALSCQGNAHLSTPHMDRLCSQGMTFTNSYSANPVCGPARSCWYTGRHASELGVLSNHHYLRTEIPNLRNHMRDYGYEELYIGKYGVFYEHSRDHYPIAGDAMGELSDAGIAQAASAFLMNQSKEKPFFLSLGFHQPHDICFWVREYRRLPDALPFPEIADQLPPLPENFNALANDPKYLGDNRSFWGWKDWPEWQWRYYLWSYYRMVEMVDAQVGQVMASLERSGRLEDTLVIFTSDHGEGCAEHQLALKSHLYDSAARVPLSISWKGHIPAGVVDSTTLVSGIDLAPTLCDYAGIEPLPKQSGLSLRPKLERGTLKRSFIVAEDSRGGRLIRKGKHAYFEYPEEKKTFLFNLANDPGETKNLSKDQNHTQVEQELRTTLHSYFDKLECPEPIVAKK